MEISRPDWDSYFLGVALLISARSRDKETKHGTVIVDKNNLILGTGYNSFIKGVRDETFPDVRPYKYPFMIHSELNALLNCKSLPRETGGGRAYVTGKCCNHCLQSLIQAGITEIITLNRRGTMLEDESSLKTYNKIIEETGIKVTIINYDTTWMKQVIHNYEYNKTV